MWLLGVRSKIQISETSPDLIADSNIISAEEKRPTENFFKSFDSSSDFYLGQVVKVIGISAGMETECAGTLISSNYIITSNSCLEPIIGSGKKNNVGGDGEGYSPEELVVVNLPFLGIGNAFKVKKINFHENYSNYTMVNDILLLKLSISLDSLYINYPKIYDAVIEKDTPLKIDGYDMNSIDKDLLLPTRRTIINTTSASKNVCNRHLMDKKKSCIFVRNSKSICMNNRGGPVFNSETPRKLIGVISTWIPVNTHKSLNIAPSYTCAANGDVIFYTLLKPYVKWLSKKTKYQEDYFN
ncbi:Trypsin [Smittium mucronatum]|uniref:Trypsin n=1 Tax=Smittium mucronatum TaxID=133383 RepID=A0A1R0GPR1_9FUNG|nr:Trypsin [Smittium mucronatum]OLY79759.1 Trypsin [Smittium mucronatum]